MPAMNLASSSLPNQILMTQADAGGCHSVAFAVVAILRVFGFAMMGRIGMDRGGGIKTKSPQPQHQVLTSITAIGMAT